MSNKQQLQILKFPISVCMFLRKMTNDPVIKINKSEISIVDQYKFPTNPTSVRHT